jgi:cell division protein FtsB
MNEKDLILNEVKELQSEENKMGWRFLFMTLLVLAIAWLLLFPKIYLQSQVYYKSRDIAVLTGEYNVLREENRILKTKVESIRFKHQVLDTMFDD